MASLSELVTSNRPNLDPYEDLYKYLHSNPELSNQEKNTSATVVSHLKSHASSFSITPNIGGYGVAAVLKNGDGPTVLLRADFDALPIEERTGLPYASKVRMRDADGIEKPVMHACGHDMHTTALLAAAELLSSCTQAWSGTLVLIFQPAEERGTGAKAMVDDGLYDPHKHAIPIPDIALGGHVMATRAGTIGTKRGLVASSADSLRITLHGRGGHASMPDRLIDPIVMAASTVLKLQTIVSRELSQWDSAVVTVASLQAGDAENVIVDDARLAVDIRTTSDASRKRTLKSVERIVKAESMSSNAVKPPTIVETRSFPLTVNDHTVTEQLEKSFEEHFPSGEKGYNSQSDMMAGSEDFTVLATAVDRPSCFFTYGGTPPELWDKCEEEGTLNEKIPVNHSSLFAPDIQPTLTVGTDAYALGALTWLIKK